MGTDRYDLVILGGGTAGLVSAFIAAGVGARVALVERERTGGDCLWTGCVPSKSLLASAHAAHRLRHLDAVGLEPIVPDIDFARVMDRVHAVIAVDRAARLARPAAGRRRRRHRGRGALPRRLDARGRRAPAAVHLRDRRHRLRAGRYRTSPAWRATTS